MLQPVLPPLVPVHRPVISHTTQAPPYSPTLINLNQRYNMSANSLTEALLLLSGMYISLVQPDPGPVKVGLHAVLPVTSGDFVNVFTETNKRWGYMNMKYDKLSRAFNISSSLSRSSYTPKDILKMLCDQVFPRNIITVFYINNHLSLSKYTPQTANYLPKIIASLGLPVISYDTQFSPQNRPELSLQLAPTTVQMLDVVFSFLKNFGWTDFSFLCTLSLGCQDEVSYIKLKIEEFKRETKFSVYGDESYTYNLLSYVNFTNGLDVAEAREKLMYGLHKDSRINLVHGEGPEVKTIMEVASSLNLTAKDYVWIFSYSSITLRSTFVDESYPLGSFIIAYNASKEAMTDIVRTGVNIWLEALNSLAKSPDILHSIDFTTGFSCDRTKDDQIADNNDTSTHPLYWKHGEKLYSYLLKSKLPGELEFDDYGVLKANRFYILNVQKQVNITTPGVKEDFSRGGGRDDDSNRGSHSKPSRGSTYTSYRRTGEDDDSGSPLDRSRGSRNPMTKDNDTRSTYHRDTASRSIPTRSASSRTNSDTWPSPHTSVKHSGTLGSDDQLSRDRNHDTSGSKHLFEPNEKDSMFGSARSYSSSTYSRDRNFKSRFTGGRGTESTSRNEDSEATTSLDNDSPAQLSKSRSPQPTSQDNVRETDRRSSQDRNSDWSLKSGTYENGTPANLDPYQIQNASHDDSSTVGQLPFKNRNGQREQSLDSFDEVDSSHIRQGFRHSDDKPSRKSRPYAHVNFRLRDRRSVYRNRGKRVSPFSEFPNTGYLKHAGYNRSTVGEDGVIHSRTERDAEDKKVARKVADWDGHNLVIYGITWPGGEAKPPKGKPEKYILKVVTWQEDPHVIYREMKSDDVDQQKVCEVNTVPCTVYNRDKTLQRTNGTKQMCCTGLSIDLLKRLGEMLNFDVELSEVADGFYGSPLDVNMTEWNGMMGTLVKNQADMAIGAISITPERSVAVDFSVPFLQTGITIIVALRHGVISPTAFLEPYDYPSWSLILLFSVHATGASIFIFEWLSPYGLDQGKTSYSVHKFSLFRSFWLIWAMLFGASVSTDQPRGIASRFLANIWALFAVVFCASYTANLAAFMITKDTYYDLSGIQDWRLKNPHHVKPPFKFATIANSSTDVNIKKNYKDIYQYMKNEAQTDVKNAIRNLKAGDIQAFIYDSTTLEYEVGKDDGCKLKTVGKRIAETGYGVAFPKRSPWVKEVDGALLRLQENGEIERLQKHWLARACHSKKETGVSSHTLGILNFTSAFVLLGSGVVLGVLILLLEHMYFRFGRKSLRRLDKCGCCSLVSLSMGQSLTFEQSVMEAMDYHKHHRCKDPLCETQLWKVKHDLDIALLKISQLRRQLAYTAIDASKEGNYGASIEYDRGDSPYKNGQARRRRQRADDENPDKKEPFVVQPLLALEGKSDTDEDNTPVHSPNHKAGPFTSRSSFPVAKKPVGNDNKTRYSYPEQGSPRGNNRRASDERLVKRNSLGQRDPKFSDDDDIVDLDLRPPPPSFDEVMSRYTSSPTDEVMTPSPSPPLPPPPASTPPPPAAPSPPQHSPENLSGSTTSNSIPSSDNKRYEPFILDSPESPSFSSFSDTSENRLLCPGTLSKLSDEVPSTVLSQDVDSNFNSSPDISRSLEDSSNVPIVGYSDSQLSKQSKHPTSSVDNAKPSILVEDRKTDTQMSRLNSLKEADNDVNTRQARDGDSNIYVNVDEIGGKETAF